MTINHTKKCDSCKESLTEIGESVHINGGKVGDTDHYFYQCNDCGSLWVNIKDSGGLGGKGNFWQKLTERLY